ncbi:MAG: hypothetical protein QOG64_2966 [Acidimicrobiaceae bacterium]|nr:hypothetical protein [Acidimicrobiaceae bacterium]
MTAMGWCHEFGPQIAEGCDHPMTAGPTSCHCELCGIECKGKFAACSAVWARGPRELTITRSRYETLTTDPPPGLAVVEAEFRGAAAEPQPEAQPDLHPVEERTSIPANGVRVDRPEPADGWRSNGVQEFAAALTERIRSTVVEALATQRGAITTEIETIGTELRAALAVIPDRSPAVSEEPAWSPEAMGELGAVVAREMAAVALAVQEACGAALAQIGEAALDLRQSVAEVNVLAAELRDFTAVDAAADGLRSSVGDVQMLTVGLRDEMARLAAFRRALSDGYPAVARAVEHASVRAATRFSELTRAIEDLSQGGGTDAAGTPNGHGVGQLVEDDDEGGAAGGRLHP